jgi:hypothetical protein
MTRNINYDRPQFKSSRTAPPLYRWVFTWGPHKGKSVLEVPTDYLLKLRHEKWVPLPLLAKFSNEIDRRMRIQNAKM